MHPISRVDTEDISASLRASPVEVPVIVSRHLNPSTLLEVIQQDGFVHVGAKANLHSLVLVVSDSGIALAVNKHEEIVMQTLTVHTLWRDSPELRVYCYREPFKLILLSENLS